VHPRNVSARFSERERKRRRDRQDDFAAVATRKEKEREIFNRFENILFLSAEGGADDPLLVTGEASYRNSG